MNPPALHSLSIFLFFFYECKDFLDQMSQHYLKAQKDILMPSHFFWHVVKEESTALVKEMVVEPPCICSWGIKKTKYSPSWPKAATVLLECSAIKKSA